MNIVIVESAAKAKAINKYLGSSYKVLASYGHVRDLPSKKGAVEPDNDFEMHWAEDDDRAKKVMRDITEAVKNADKVILATDPDREGEAISWHILEMLQKRKAIKKGTPVERITFNAITKQSVTDAMKAPREIDAPLVEAYFARRALDYLVGFTLSPVLWTKLPGARSAGRVQSVVLRLICVRELEIEKFRTDEYWTIVANLATAKDERVEARLQHIAGDKLDKLSIKTEASAMAIKAAIEGGDFRVAKVEKKATKRNPYAPFATSTLQMDASRRLGFSAKQTMNLAQRLYEGVEIGGETVGLITYMRTDGVTIIPEAVQAIRRQIEADFGKPYVAPFIREYKAKAKNAQEAHEAIRPTDIRRKPAEVARYVERDQARLYELIWKRAVASQMASADIEQTAADIDVKGRDGKPYGLRATGSVIQFEGFLKLYEEGRDDRQRGIDKGKDDKADEDDDRRLPALATSDRLKDRGIDANQHFTQPPPRFTESSLVKRMEELGIGRPSTYASTMATLVDRDYVRMEKKQLVPEDKGRLVTAFLESFFLRYVEYDYTASLEEQLDLISDHKLQWKDVLRDFWREFMAAVNGTKELKVSDVLDVINDLLGPHIFPDKGDGTAPRQCPKCGLGQLSLKISRTNGAFIGCSNYNSEATPCRYTRQLSQSGEGSGTDGGTIDGKVLGNDPVSGEEVTVRSGRFGIYLQLGEAKSKDEKPKRASIPKGWDPETLDLERAMRLLNLPRMVGIHPESQAAIQANIGKYGPYVMLEAAKGSSDKPLYANLDTVDEVFEIGLNRAVTVLAEKKTGGGKGRFGRGTAQRKVILDLGEHPELGGKVEVLDGRYGPYITHNKVNANVPRGREPATVTLTEAVGLLAERAAKGGGSKRRPAAKAKSKASDDGAAAKGAKPKSKPKSKSKSPTRRGSTKPGTDRDAAE